jgi:hypothetical protein
MAGLGWVELDLHRIANAQIDPPLDPKVYGAMGLFTNAARGVGQVFVWLAGAAQWLATIIALGPVIVTLTGAAL